MQEAVKQRIYTSGLLDTQSKASVHSNYLYFLFLIAKVL